MELAASDKQRILAWGDGLSVSPALRYATAGHAMDSSFKAFVDQLTAWVPAVTAKKDGDAVVTLPTLYPSDRMAYQAIPLNRELDPFLAVMADARTFVDRIDKDVRQHVARLGIPSLFKVFITPHCPHCPIAVATLLGLAGCSEQVRVTSGEDQWHGLATGVDVDGALLIRLADGTLERVLAGDVTLRGHS